MKRLLLFIMLFFFVTSLSALDWKKEGDSLVFQTGKKKYTFTPGDYSGLKLPGKFHYFLHINEVTEKSQNHNKLGRKALSVREVFRTENSLGVVAEYPITRYIPKTKKRENTPFRAILQFQIWKDVPGVRITVKPLNPGNTPWNAKPIWVGSTFAKGTIATGFSTSGIPRKVLSDPKSKNINLPGGPLLFLDSRDGRTNGIIGSSFRHKRFPYIHLLQPGTSLVKKGTPGKDFSLVFMDSPKNYEELEKYAKIIDILDSTSFLNSGTTRFLGKDGQIPFRSSFAGFFPGKNSLKIRFTGYEPTPEKMKTTCFAAGDNIWTDDCAELFLLVNKKAGAYIHVMTNSVPNTGYNIKDRSFFKIPPEKLFRTTARKGKDFWGLEWEIDHRLFDQELLKKEKVIFLHINREVPKQKEYTGWPTPDFHKVSSFGRVILCSYSEYLRIQQNICRQIAAKVPALKKTFASVLQRAIPASLPEQAFFDHKLQICRGELEYEILLKEAYSLLKKAGTLKNAKEKEAVSGKLAKTIPELEALAAGNPRWLKKFNLFQAAYLRQIARGKSFLVWKKSPWNYLRSGDFPSFNAQKPNWQLDMGIGEYESAAVAVTNFSKTTLNAHVRVVSNPSKVPLTIRYGFTLLNKAQQEVNDALPLLGKSLAIPSGTSKELFFTVHSGKLKPGKHKIVLAVSDGKKQEEKVTLLLTVHNVVMEKDKEYIGHFFTPIIFSKGLGEVYHKAIQEDMRKHYVNAYMGGDIPKAKFTADGRNITDYDSFIQRRIGDDFPKDFYCFHYWYFYMQTAHTFRPKMEKMFGEPFMGPAFRKKFMIWVKDWWKAIEKRGLADRLFMYVADETTHSDILQVMEMMRKEAPQIKLFMAVTNTSTPKDLARTSRILSAVSPHYYTWKKHQLGDYRKNGVKIIPYFNVTPCFDQAEPYNVYRRMGMLAKDSGSCGFGTWTHIYNNLHSWREAKMTMIYMKHPKLKDSLIGAPELQKGELIVPSKRFEAFREGTEDFFYLRMVEERAKKYPSHPSSAKAKKLVAEALREITNNKNNHKDLASQYKLRFIKMLQTFPKCR